MFSYNSRCHMRLLFTTLVSIIHLSITLSDMWLTIWIDPICLSDHLIELEKLYKTGYFSASKKNGPITQKGRTISSMKRFVFSYHSYVLEILKKYTPFLFRAIWERFSSSTNLAIFYVKKSGSLKQGCRDWMLSTILNTFVLFHSII